ncbi:MAG TPA: Rieske 2Fe-2S domain-containing protein [Candidatus Limnocylindrales bacterium]|nr:Rieske 2Fe-2S domain-containing protein [Candidatus Limnocylindrales bacterium]
MSAGGPLARPDDRDPIAVGAITTLRNRPTTGMSRRSLLRRSLGAAVGVWLVEAFGGLISAVWPVSGRATPRVRVGTRSDLIDANGGLPIADGFPAYVADARAFVMTIDPARPWQPGSDPTGDGTALNVRAVSQRCPHLGCRPNPCVEDFWFRCPCHQSRYDRLGIKAAGVTFGPAARGMDRYAIEVDRDGVLTIDTSHIALGPLPVALGQPGLIPPRVAHGCGG